MFDKVTRFSFPTTILFGCGAVRELPACLKEIGAKKPLLVTDPGLKGAEPFKKTVAALEAAGQAYAVFGDVHPNPVEGDVDGAAAAFRAGGCDSVIGLGGGSPLDVAKAAVVRVAHEGPLAQFEAQAGGWEKIVNPMAPVITIPTTAGTGSEVGRSAVITMPELGRKIVIFSPKLMPARAILDPDLTLGLPANLTAATGMDAFTHCLESLTSPEFHPLCDAVAIHGLELIIEHLERAVKHGGDVEARGYMLIAASMGAIAFQKDLGATHSLAHPLSTEFNVHHGLANAVCLPAVMRFNIEAAEKHYARLAYLFGMEEAGASERQAAEFAAGMVASLVDRLGLPTRLRDCGVAESALPALAKKAFEDSCHKTNPRPCTEADLLALYKESW